MRATSNTIRVSGSVIMVAFVLSALSRSQVSAQPAAPLDRPPAPADKFVLMLRMYWPKDKPPSLLDGTWTIPGVKQAP